MPGNTSSLALCAHPGTRISHRPIRQTGNGPPNLEGPREIATENVLKTGCSNSAQTRMEPELLQNPVSVFIRLCNPTRHRWFCPCFETVSFCSNAHACEQRNEFLDRVLVEPTVEALDAEFFNI